MRLRLLLGLYITASVLLSAAAGFAQSRRPRHVYTNDDPQFSRSTPDASNAEEPPAARSGSTASEPASEKLAPFVATPSEVVDKMLEMAKPTERDVVYDLGSGDGRIVIAAAKKYGCKAVGVELDRHLVEESRDNIRNAGLETLVTIVQGDLLRTSLKDATLVTVYLLPSAIVKLRPVLEEQLTQGAKVISHDMRIPGWEPAREEALDLNGGTHYIYLYEIPGAYRRGRSAAGD